MLVNTLHFCGLSTDPKFLTWLRGTAEDIFQSLMEHTRAAHGCTANARKMIWVLDQLVKRPGLEESLAGFLREHFPHVISTPKVSVDRSTPVFDHYDPALLTLPRRLILDSEEAAVQFLRDKVGEYVVVDGRAYVEFLPADLAGLASQIPAANWQTRAWRASHGSAGDAVPAE